MSTNRKYRIDTVSKFIPGADEPFSNAAKIAKAINKEGYLIGRNRKWEVGDVYRAVREMRHDYPQFGVASLPTKGYRFEESADAEDVKRSKKWASRTARSRLRNIHRGLTLPLASETEKVFLNRAFQRLEEDIITLLEGAESV